MNTQGTNISQLRQPIYLIGFMATGKTTLGHEVQRLYGVEFFDLDQEVERTAGMTVSEIFSRHGEAHFRLLERGMLEMLTRLHPHAVIACGGGTPCQPGAMDFMLEHGHPVWLTTTPQITVQRLLKYSATRPLVAGKSAAELKDTVERMLQQRQPYYSRAKATFNTSDLDDPRDIPLAAHRFAAQFLQ